MKLLLTSGGITNSSLADSLHKLVGKNPNKTKIAYVPIAANAEAGNKDWVIKDFINYWRYGYNYIDIIDPSSADVDWEPRLAEADIIALSGGNTFHLLNQLRKTGLGEWLNKNLGEKVYVGGSASSIIATPNIGVARIGVFGDKNLPGITDLSGLNWVDFEIIPHVPGWASYKDCEQYAKTTKNKVYALDDSSAILVKDGKPKVISEGAWKQFNK